MEVKVDGRPPGRAEAPAEPKETGHTAPVAHSQLKLEAADVNLWYGDKQALFDVNLEVFDRSVTALIGPSGCGKSTFLRCFNRMNDVIDICRVQGNIRLDGRRHLRARCRSGAAPRPGWHGVPEAKSVSEIDLRERGLCARDIHGLCATKADLEQVVETSLRKAGLWEEVKDRLDEPGTGLSGGQQQRLCIARAISVNPEVLLMDEPCSALDPIATATIETLMDELKENLCIVIVTHSMQQAARVSQRTAFFHLGKLVEVDETSTIFTNPTDQRTQDYVTGRFG